MINDWPFIKIDSEPGMSNGATVPVKMVVVVSDLAPSGCVIHMAGGHVVNLHSVSRASLTASMEDALAGRGSKP